MKKNMFMKALNTESGKSSFALMCIFIIATIVISSVFADKSWSTIGAFITCFMSFSAGGEFCKEILRNK